MSIPVSLAIVPTAPSSCLKSTPQGREALYCVLKLRLLARAGARAQAIQLVAIQAVT